MTDFQGELHETVDNDTQWSKDRKRDFELMRSLMLQIEEEASPDNQLRIVGDAECYQLLLLKEEEFVQCELFLEESPWESDVERLTMKGHDFLDNIRNNTVWGKVKDKVKAIGGTASLAVVAETATLMVKELLKG